MSGTVTEAFVEMLTCNIDLRMRMAMVDWRSACKSYDEDKLNRLLENAPMKGEVEVLIFEREYDELYRVLFKYDGRSFLVDDIGYEVLAGLIDPRSVHIEKAFSHLLEGHQLNNGELYAMTAAEKIDI